MPTQFQGVCGDFILKVFPILNNRVKEVLIVWLKVTQSIQLQRFAQTKFNISGKLMTQMLIETVQFSIGTYLDLDENCYTNDWTFDNSFLFVGSLATTIGYGHIVPKTTQGRLLCIVFIILAVPLFAILLQFISLYINENLAALTDKINLKLARMQQNYCVRLLKKILRTKELKCKLRVVKVFYFIFGCGLFLLVPAYIFHLVEDWSYTDAVYFAIISLSKVGFGDFVPNTQPPDKYALPPKQDKQKCLFLYLNPAPMPPGNFHDAEAEACKASEWSTLVVQLFAVYRVLVNFWMIIGLSFFGTLISIMSNAINDVITKKAPSFLNHRFGVNMGNILHIINATGAVAGTDGESNNKCIKNELWVKGSVWSVYSLMSTLSTNTGIRLPR